MRSILFLSVILVPLCLLVGCDDKTAREKDRSQTKDDWVRSPEIGRPAPDIEGYDLDGVFFKLRDKEYKGKVIMLDFWAKWCPPCMKFLPHGKSLVQKFKGRPFDLLGVNYDSAEKLPKSGDLVFRCWTDGNPHEGDPCLIARRWKVEAFPTIFLIDHKGILRKIFLGPPPDLDGFDNYIERLVKSAENDRAQQPASKDGNGSD